MTEFKVNLNMGILTEGMFWLEHWNNLPKAETQKKYDIPPRGAAGEAVITLMWAAETLLYVAKLRARVDAGELSEDAFQVLRTEPVFKTLGSSEAVKLADELPDNTRAVVRDSILYSRHIVRMSLRPPSNRPGTATRPWIREKTIGTVVGGEDAIAATANAFLPNIPAGPQLLVVLAWPIVVLGIGGAAAAAWYGSEVAEAGVKIEAEKAFSMAQAWQNIKIAQAQLAKGKDVKIAPFMSRGAQIEAAQSSPITIGLVGAAAGAATVAGVVLGMKKRRSNPSRLRQIRTVAGRSVAVSKSRSTGKFRAYTIDASGKKGRTINVSKARTYEQAFDAAAYDIRKRRKKNPATAVANPKKKRRKKATKKRTKKRAKRKTTKRKTKRKTTKRKTTKRKTTKRRTKKRATKRKTTKKRKTKRKRNPAIKKATFIRKQRSKGRSDKQAAADWKGRTRLRKQRKAA